MNKTPIFFYIMIAFIAMKIFGSGVLPIVLVFAGIAFFNNNVARKKNQSDQNQSRQQAPRKNVNTPVRNTVPTPQRRQSSNFSKSNPFKKSGIEKYKDFDLEGAIADFQQGLAISENDVALHWNIACAYSLTEKKDKAFYHLNRAIELGFNDYDKINTHDDLAYIRIQPEFEDFKANGYKLNGGLSSNNESKQIAQPEKEDLLTDDILLSQLNKLAELRKKGLLSEQEFVLERKKLLRR